MALQHVYQVDTNGCFVAAVAMILGKTYPETRRLVFPEQHPDGYLASGLMDDPINKISITDAAIAKMKSLGMKVHLSKYEQLRSVFKYAKKNAIILLRWKWDLERLHAVVFDADARVLLDPADYRPRNDRIKYPTAHIESIMWVDAPKPRLEKDNAEGRDEQGDQRAAFHPEGASGGTEQALFFASHDAPQRQRRCRFHYGGGSQAASC